MDEARRNRPAYGTHWQVEARDAEIAGLRSALASLVPAADLELLRRRMEGMVPRAELESAQDEVARLRKTIEGLFSKYAQPRNRLGFMA